MRFINPKIDVAFKRIFGSIHSKDILLSFLNAILYDEQPVLTDLEILDPYLAPKVRGMKDTYLDVKARTAEQQTVIIEMQVLNTEGFEKRILYNAAKTYSTQLQQGEAYHLLNPVIALTITDFVLFPQFDKLLSRFVLTEKEMLVDYADQDLVLVFVELPKFQKSLETLTNLKEQWLYFLKHAHQLEEVPQTMDNVPALRHAFEIANQSNLSREDLEDLEHRQIFIHDQHNAILKAHREGREEGVQQGREEGVQQGLQQGREEGSQQEKLEIARNLLKKGMTWNVITEVTGLTPAEFTRLEAQATGCITSV